MEIETRLILLNDKLYSFMKRIQLLALMVFVMLTAHAQEKKLYNPKADADSAIKVALKQAKAQHKYVLLQGGGNWCSWCIEFARFCKADPKIDSVMNAGFIW